VKLVRFARCQRAAWNQRLRYALHLRYFSSFTYSTGAARFDSPYEIRAVSATAFLCGCSPAHYGDQFPPKRLEAGWSPGELQKVVDHRLLPGGQRKSGHCQDRYGKLESRSCSMPLIY